MRWMPPTGPTGSRHAIKELARHEGRLATFMPKPFNDEGGSGYHLHFSMWSPDGRPPLFDDPAEPHGLSEVARHAVAGILAHAPALAAVANPTINSYKRFGPDTLAPWLIDWGMDNRSAMVRIPPERGSASRMELRLGDASANSYLAIAGHARGGAARRPPRARAARAAGRLRLRRHQGREAARRASAIALDALEADTEFADVLGEPFANTFLTYKRDEIERFNSWITDWEFHEYTYHL